jgi:monooxygenase
MAEAIKQHVDVLVVGAGLSGIAAGYHLQTNCPGKTYAIFEARDAIGGTWDLFRYPGIRSDSDMFTLGYPFRPWKDAKAIADGPAILDYVREAAREYDIEQHISFNHRVVRAGWSSAEARWTVEAERTDTGETVRLTCGFLFMCSGYYRYDQGYAPEMPGAERFTGPVVHPQHWPRDLDYEGKRVVVIGSGATAVTIVPAMAEQAAHVTMLQRSPSYVLSLPGQDPIADLLRKLLPAKVAHRLARWKNVMLMMGTFKLSRRWPRLMKALLRKGVQRRLPPGYDVDTHFRPSYDPWDQRMCLVPDGDLFEAINAGRASVVTDRIETFTETGVKLVSGHELEADVIVTATGLNMLVLGGIELAVDGQEIDVSQTLSYKGCMLGGVPNFALAIGYTNASWTLKSDLICRYVTRLVNHMDAHGYRQATPRPPASALPAAPLMNLTSGYVLRSIALFPKQGPEDPWRIHQNYLRDIRAFRRVDLHQDMEFSAPAPPAHTPVRLAA